MNPIEISQTQLYQLFELSESITCNPSRVAGMAILMMINRDNIDIEKITGLAQECINRSANITKINEKILLILEEIQNNWKEKNKEKMLNQME